MKRQALYMTVAVILAIMALLVLIARGSFGGRIKQLDGFASGEYTLTAYTMTTCPHCIALKPEFEKLGTSQTVNGKTVKIVEDASQKNPAIRGYPTILLSGPGGDKEYQGERTADGILAFLKASV